MIDCKDSYDEQPKFCNNKCKDSEFTCPNGTCIPESQKCDGLRQCHSGQDEMLPLCGKLVALSTSCFLFDMLVKCKSKLRGKKTGKKYFQVDKFMTA